MLIPLSVILARAKRRKTIVPSFGVSTAEIMTATVEAAEHAGHPVILVIDATQPHTLPFSLLCRTAYLLAKESSADIAIQAVLEPTQEAVEAALRLGIPALSFDDSQASKRRKYELTAWAVKESALIGSEVVGNLGGFATTERLGAFLHETGVPVVSLPIELESEGQKVVSLPYIQQVSRLARIPLIAQEAALSARAIRECAKAGISSITLSRLLDHAYTAGIRTGLRSRSVAEPRTYQKVAMKAVKNAALSYLHQSL